VIALDTNVLLRYLLDDDPPQSAAARHLIDELCSTREPAFVHEIVLAEIVWVLRRRPVGTRRDIVHTLRKLLDHASLAFSDEAAFAAAIDAYEDGPADFAEYLVAASARARGAVPTFTFDEDAAKSPAFSLLRI
jgi:predicted nucleic-acid-binding protein